MVVSSAEANYWWRKNDPAGALLNSLMLLFIAVPIALVLKSFYAFSFAIFAFIVPYGFFLRHLAVRAVEQYLQSHPEEFEKFEEAGIISS
jgi:ABC-type glycerol-3-phosphate transport system permease component